MGTNLAQMSAGCEPKCDPSGDDFDADTDHTFKSKIDVSKDVVEDVKPIVEEALSAQGVQESLAAVIGEDGAEGLMNEVITPCMDSAVADMLPVDEVIEAEKSINKEDEKFEVTDKLPAPADVATAIADGFDEKHAKEGLEFKTGTQVDTNFTEEQLANSHAEELTIGDKKMAVITIPATAVADKVKDNMATHGKKDADDINSTVTKEVVEDVAADTVNEMAKDIEGAE